MMFDYTVAQAAVELKLSPQRVRQLLKKGRLMGYQAVSPGGRVVWRIHLSLRRIPGKPGRPRTKRASKKLFLVNHK
ncbi:MAG: hypothetical protein ACYCY1_08865 [Sulfuriferula sp.]